MNFTTSVDCLVGCLQFNSLPHDPKFLTTLKEKAFENIDGKGENAG